MLGLMADNDIQGQFKELLHVFLSPTWRDVWDGLHVSIQTFETVGLARSAADVLVWQVCQSRQVVLVTGNRKSVGPDSLEATIRSQNTPDSLPVVTISGPKLIPRNRIYTERVAEKILEYLLEIDNYRGAGRIWVP